MKVVSSRYFCLLLRTNISEKNNFYKTEVNKKSRYALLKQGNYDKLLHEIWDAKAADQKKTQYQKFKSFDVTQTGGTQKVSVMSTTDDVYYLLSQ